MTQDEIISMAREAGFPPTVLKELWTYGYCCIVKATKIERFAALVAAHEREKLQMVRAIALEEAAQLCMDYGREGFSAHVIARAIKGLK